MTVFPDSLADLHAHLETLWAECQRLPQEAALRRKLEAALWELQDCERCRQQPLALGELPNGIYRARLRALRSYIAHLQAQAERAARCPQDLPNGVMKNADENCHTRDYRDYKEKSNFEFIGRNSIEKKPRMHPMHPA